MKTSLFFLSFMLSFSMVQATSISTPEATLKFVSADGKPVAGVALTGMLGYEALSRKKCGPFGMLDCGDSNHESAYEYKSQSEGGEILGLTDENGSLVVPAKTWVAEEKSAKNLNVLFFTNATFDVNCIEDGKTIFKGFVDLLPQWIDGKLAEREYDCSNLNFKQGDNKRVEFKCTSVKTMEQIEAEVAKIKSNCEK